MKAELSVCHCLLLYTKYFPQTAEEEWFVSVQFQNARSVVAGTLGNTEHWDSVDMS